VPAGLCIPQPYKAKTGRYVHVDWPEHTRRARVAPPAAESRPTPVPSGPVPPRPLLPETVRARPVPLMEVQFPAPRVLAPRALMGIQAFSLVEAWRSQVATRCDPARPPPAETARQPSSPQGHDLPGPVDAGDVAPLVWVGEDAFASGAYGADPRCAVARPVGSRDTGFGSPLDAPVPADLATPLQPSVMSASQPYPPQAPVEVHPPGAETSGPCEVKAPAHWEEQVEEAEASDEFQRRPTVVPDWANL